MLEGCRHDGELGEWIDLVSSFWWRGRSGVGPLDDDDDGEMLMGDPTSRPAVGRGYLTEIECDLLKDKGACR